jgi:hypothetical protein
MPVRAALTTYTYFLRSILTPPMPVRPVPRVCRAMSRGRVALFAGFASSTQARRELTPYRVQLPLGLLLRFRLFPTPPRGDAVAFRFTPGSRFGGGQIFTDWIVCSHDHTCPRHLAVVRAGGGPPPLPLRTKRLEAASTPGPRSCSAAFGGVGSARAAAAPPAPVTHKAAGSRFHTRASLLVRRLRPSWQREGGGGKRRVPTASCRGARGRRPPRSRYAQSGRMPLPRQGLAPRPPPSAELAAGGRRRGPAPVTHKAAGCRFHTRASLLVRRLRRSWQREGGGGKSRVPTASCRGARGRRRPRSRYAQSGRMPLPHQGLAPRPPPSAELAAGGRRRKEQGAHGVLPWCARAAAAPLPLRTKRQDAASTPWPRSCSAAFGGVGSARAGGGKSRVPTASCRGARGRRRPPRSRYAQSGRMPLPHQGLAPAPPPSAELAAGGRRRPHRSRYAQSGWKPLLRHGRAPRPPPSAELAARGRRREEQGAHGILPWCARAAAAPPLPLRTKRQDAASTPWPRSCSAAFGGVGSARAAAAPPAPVTHKAAGSRFHTRASLLVRRLRPSWQREGGGGAPLPLRTKRQDAASTPGPRSSSAAFGGVGSARAAGPRSRYAQSGWKPLPHQGLAPRPPPSAELAAGGRRREEEGAHGILPWCARAAAAPPAPVTHKAAGSRFHTRASLLVRRLRRSWQRAGGGGPPAPVTHKAAGCRFHTRASLLVRRLRRSWQRAGGGDPPAPVTHKAAGSRFHARASLLVRRLRPSWQREGGGGAPLPLRTKRLEAASTPGPRSSSAAFRGGGSARAAAAGPRSRYAQSGWKPLPHQGLAAQFDLPTPFLLPPSRPSRSSGEPSRARSPASETEKSPGRTGLPGRMRELESENKETGQ